MGEGVERLKSGDGTKVMITSPAGSIPSCRAFYQIEEDTLIAALHPGGRFFSFLDGPGFHLDIDSEGRLLSLQILKPRREWIQRPDLRLPSPGGMADVRFLGFRDRLAEMVIESSPSFDLVHLHFPDVAAENAYHLADRLLVDIGSGPVLGGFWIADVEDDRAARKMSLWRKEMRNDKR